MKLALGLLLGGLIWAETHGAVAIKDVRIITVSGDELAKGTVVMRNGFITDVGAMVTVPADAWVIDGSGLTVYPGFIDGLSSWGIPASATPRGGSQTPAATTTAEPRARGPEDRPQTYSFERAADLVSPSDTRLETARAAGFIYRGRTGRCDQP